MLLLFFFFFFLHCLSICKLLLLFFCTVCPYVNCLLLFFCTVWSTLIRISLTKALADYTPRRGGRGNASTHRVQITLACHKTFNPWSDPSFPEGTSSTRTFWSIRTTRRPFAYINRQGSFHSRRMRQARPPPPPLESEESEVPSCHPHPRSVNQAADELSRQSLFTIIV